MIMGNTDSFVALLQYMCDMSGFEDPAISMIKILGKLLVGT